MRGLQPPKRCDFSCDRLNLQSSMDARGPMRSWLARPRVRSHILKCASKRTRPDDGAMAEPTRIRSSCPTPSGRRRSLSSVRVCRLARSRVAEISTRSRTPGTPRAGLPAPLSGWSPISRTGMLQWGQMRRGRAAIPTASTIGTRSTCETRAEPRQSPSAGQPLKDRRVWCSSLSPSTADQSMGPARSPLFRPGRQGQRAS